MTIKAAYAILVAFLGAGIILLLKVALVLGLIALVVFGGMLVAMVWLILYSTFDRYRRKLSA